MTDSLTTMQALEVFLRGFSTTRSYIRPYLPQQLARNVWVLADPPSKSGQSRTPEVTVYGASPAELLDAIRSSGVGHHTLCVLIDTPKNAPSAADAFKRAGYRLRRRETLFTLDLSQRTLFEAVPIRRICDPASADALNRAAGSRLIFPQHYTTADSECRVYAAYDGGIPIGWVRSIRTHPDRSWVAGLYVRLEYRRRGIGRTLMSAMLEEDARYDVQWSVLLASAAGSFLYPHLGYQSQGLLLVFSPVRG